jgi:nucleoside phosphorylase
MDGAYISPGRLGTARVAILTIVEPEFQAVQRQLKADSEVPGTEFVTPNPTTLDVILAKSRDRGNVPAGEATASLLEKFRPEVILVCGIAARIAAIDRDAVMLGDVVVPAYLHYAEYVKHSPGKHLRRYAAHEQPATDLRATLAEPVRRNNGWRESIDVARPGTGEPEVWTEGGLVAGERLLDDPGSPLQQAVVEDFSDAVAVDMESFGVARAVHHARTEVTYNPRLLVVRGMSDTVSVGKDEDTDNDAVRRLWRPYAASVSGAFVRHLVDRFLSTPDARTDLRHHEREGR